MMAEVRLTGMSKRDMCLWMWSRDRGIIVIIKSAY